MNLNPKHIRYLKLGRKEGWAQVSLKRGELHFGHRHVPHELCVSGDWDGVVKLLIKRGKTPGKAKDQAREIRDFYSLGKDCLWITFTNGHLYWTFADPSVTWLGEKEEGQGARSRKAIGGWRNTDLTGQPLRIDELSSRLTRTAAYRGTLCTIQCEDYLLRRLRGEEEPVIAKARKAKKALTKITEEMISGLHWADFEDLVDLIFSRSGWQRLSRVGGTQKDIDLEMIEPATGSRAFVQVKSTAGQKQLDDYINRWEAIGGYDFMFFVCHSPRSKLSFSAEKNIRVWTNETLAQTAIRAGLYDWLMERSI